MVNWWSEKAQKTQEVDFVLNQQILAFFLVKSSLNCIKSSYKGLTSKDCGQNGRFWQNQTKGWSRFARSRELIVK